MVVSLAFPNALPSGRIDSARWRSKNWIGKSRLKASTSISDDKSPEAAFGSPIAYTLICFSRNYPRLTSPKKLRWSFTSKFWNSKHWLLPSLSLTMNHKLQCVHKILHFFIYLFSDRKPGGRLQFRWSSAAIGSDSEGDESSGRGGGGDGKRGSSGAMERV